MKERPILFSAPMVRAILDGTKTQTRRIVKGEMLSNLGDLPHVPAWITAEEPRLCPYGQPGDRLWVREAFSGPRHQENFPPSSWHSLDAIHYWADGDPADGDWTRPRPSIHMPRWASRITLEVIGVRTERLQNISEADAIAEGIPTNLMHYDGRPATPVEAYASLWEQINGPGSWDANPWVWVVEFRRIDQFRQAA